MGEVVSLPVFVSRVAHTVSGALLLAVVAAPYLFQDAGLAFDHKYLIAATALMFGTGVFNAIKLNPKKMGDKGGFWRGIVYGAKLVTLVALTPVTNRIVGNELAQPVKVGAAVSAFALGAYARFYREKHADPNWKQ